MLPNGRLITPQGHWITTAPYPFALALRPDGRQIAIPSVGWPFSLNILDEGSVHRRLFRLQSRRQVPPAPKSEAAVKVINAVAYSADGELLYVSTGNSGAVDLYATSDWHKVSRLSLNGPATGTVYGQSFSGAMALSADGRRLYVIDQANWRVGVFDTKSRRQILSLPTGVNPFSLALSPDGTRLYVGNSGLFEYKRVPGLQRKDLLGTGLHFPPFGYPSQAAREGSLVEGQRVSGLGSENDPRGSSVWTYDVADAQHPKLLAELRLGQPIEGNPAEHTDPVVGGAAPMGIVAGSGAVYVSLAHEDAVAVLSAEGDRQVAEIALTPFAGHQFEDRQGRALRGVMPAGMALHGTRLYVTESGINAVAVIATGRGEVLGHMPVGWFPSAANVSADGRSLFVVNTKGRGAGPNGGAEFHPEGTGSYIGEREFGSLSVVPLGNEVGLRRGTEEVVANNLAALTRDAVVPKLAHVFLVIRENRTFEEILGDLPGADGDPALARWGLRGWTTTAPTDHTVRVTPNAHALAARFATSDRFSWIAMSRPTGIAGWRARPRRRGLTLPGRRTTVGGGQKIRRARRQAGGRWAAAPMRRCRKMSHSSVRFGSTSPMPGCPSATTAKA